MTPFRVRSGAARDERGFTVVELMVTLFVMGIIASAALSVMVRAFTDSGIVQNRRDVFGDGQIALGQMSKQFRQGAVVGVDTDVSVTVTTVTVDTYVGGSTERVIWRATGSQAPYQLQVSTDDGTTYRTVLSNLVTDQVFTLVPHENSVQELVIDEIDITLVLGTKTQSVRIQSKVNLRNAQNL
ncbi:MAG: prepilin-type N-terminal cleavage/methylation domain-containing protein [Actinomycetota bacterium]